MKRLVVLVFAALISCRQVDVPYGPYCHNAIGFAVEPDYYCIWQHI